MWRFVCSVLLFLLACASYAQKKDMPRVYFKYKAYLHPEQGNYIETQLLFDAQTFDFHRTDTGDVASFQVTQLFKRGDTIVGYDKSRVQSLFVEDEGKKNFYFIEKFALPAGEYTYEMLVEDNFNVLQALNYETTIELEDRLNNPSFSSITLARFYEKSSSVLQTVFTKFGYDIVPSFTSHYPPFVDEIVYYTELYNLHTLADDSIFVLKEVVFNERQDSVYFERYSRIRAKDFLPIMKRLDTEDLPTGEYQLKLAVIDRGKNQLCTSSFGFTRKSKPKLAMENIENVELDNEFMYTIPLDSSAYYVSSLIPIAQRTETKNIIKLLKRGDNYMNMRYLQAFWSAVDEIHGLDEWLAYKKQVDRVEANFSTNYQVGHETDRGRVFLQYGYPSQIYEVPSSPSEYPYEIWQYDKIQSFTNRRFIFYNTTNVTNDYKLLHSNMVGEIQNRRWRLDINKRNAFDNDLDSDRGTGNRDHWGQNSDWYYNSY